MSLEFAQRRLKLLTITRVDIQEGMLQPKDDERAALRWLDENQEKYLGPMGRTGWRPLGCQRTDR